eukprot:m.436732 g.436732  ORF g.436732 m.436732 type:complete len:238 (+) comp56777_c0_seq1:102-815(+)
MVLIIGITGGPSSGKTEVAATVTDSLAHKGHGGQICTILQEYFYRDLTDAQKADPSSVNFDHPSAIDDELMESVLKNLKSGQHVQLFPYDHQNNCKSKEALTIAPCEAVFVVGSLLFWFPAIRAIFDMKLFVDTDSDTRLSRRVMKDLKLGRTLNSSLHQYTTHVKPAYDDFVLPMKKHADLILPRGPENMVAIDLIVKHIQLILGDKIVDEPSKAAPSLRDVQIMTTSPIASGRPH